MAAASNEFIMTDRYFTDDRFDKCEATFLAASDYMAEWMSKLKSQPPSQDSSPGEASDAIRNLALTGINFKIAWNLLLSRYNNRRRLVYDHVHALHTLPQAASDSAVALTALRDETNIAIQSLRNLGRSVDTWDDILVYLLVQKLNKGTRKAWELQLGDVFRALYDSQGLLSRIRGVMNVADRLGCYSLNEERTAGLRERPAGGAHLRLLRNYCKEANELVRSWCSCVVHRLITVVRVNIRKSISPDRLEELAEITVQLFTLHLKESYYVRSGNGKSASGAFQIVYAKEREKAFAIGKLELQPNRKRKKSSEDNLESSELQEVLKKVEIIDNDFRQKWCHTALTERVEFYKTSDLKTILNKLQNYCNPSGYLLIKADFCTYFKKSSEEFTQKWPDLAKKIIKIAQTKKNDIEINNILTSNLPTKGEEHTQTVVLILLPHLFKRITKLTTRSKSKTAWIPSVLEVKKSFIYYIKDIDDFNRTLQDANQDVLNLYAEHKLPIAPYVVVIGSSLADIKSAYISNRNRSAGS
ncbi:uncharacterized protein [Temnothorax nylanderi]|uniref:uncharacterized protein n=1 Tax=Temnothorax nylanderi TaxID=102681 RepID=UPI003A8549E6